MFDLPPAVVHSTISKMIINEELQVCKHFFLVTVCGPWSGYVCVPATY